MRTIKLFTLGTLLCLGSAAWGQKVSVNLKVFPKQVPTQATGMIVRYCELTKYEQAQKQQKKVKWDSVGTLAKPIPLTDRNAKVACLYELKNLEPSIMYVIQMYLVNGKAKGKPTQINVQTGDIDILTGEATDPATIYMRPEEPPIPQNKKTSPSNK